MGDTDAVLGTGLDSTDTFHIAAVIERFGDRFLRRVFTENEIAQGTRQRSPERYFAGLFAAKEAAMKALGTGQISTVTWRDIEVVWIDAATHLRFEAGAARRFTEMGGDRSLLSITHTRNLALAQVLILGWQENARI